MEEKIIYFDGDCGMCHSWVQFIIRKDPRKRFKFSSLQSEFAKKHLPIQYIEDLNTLVLQESEALYSKSLAVAGIFAELKFPYTWLAKLLRLLPLSLANYVYDRIAWNRQYLSKTLNCPVLKPEDRDRFLP